MNFDPFCLMLYIENIQKMCLTEGLVFFFKQRTMRFLRKEIEHASSAREFQTCFEIFKRSYTRFVAEKSSEL